MPTASPNAQMYADPINITVTPDALTGASQSLSADADPTPIGN